MDGTDVRADGLDEVGVDGGGHVVGEERGVERAGVVAGAGDVDVLEHGRAERGAERVAVSVEDGVELLEGLLPDGALARFEKYAEGALGELDFRAGFVLDRAELHVGVGELREDAAGGPGDLALHREEALLVLREDVGLEADQALEREAERFEFGCAEVGVEFLFG